MSDQKRYRIKIDDRELEDRLAAMGYENVPPGLLKAMKKGWSFFNPSLS